MRFFIEYVLGWTGESGKSADTGTNVHKVMEILALIKQGQQDGKTTIEEDELGCQFSTSTFDVEKITKKVFKYYSTRMTHHEWTKDDLASIQKSVKKAIAYNDGMLNPLNRHIIKPELHFDIEIKKPWAAYSYETPDGLITGNLAIKGTIDLITEGSPVVYEVTDYKNGASSKDWVKNTEKNAESMKEDKQFRTYHYALDSLYPNIETWMMTIFFINAGGPHTVCFTKDDLIKTEDMLKAKFVAMQTAEKPKLTRSWKCVKTCKCSTLLLKKGIEPHTFEGTNIKPIQEFRGGQVTPKGNLMSRCEQVKLEVEKKGTKRVVKEYTKPGFNPASYKAPGSA